jgi:hypothetical protein
LERRKKMITKPRKVEKERRLSILEVSLLSPRLVSMTILFSCLISTVCILQLFRSITFALLLLTEDQLRISTVLKSRINFNQPMEKRVIMKKKT